AGGWRVTGVGSFQSGAPFTVILSTDNAPMLDLVASTPFPAAAASGATMLTGVEITRAHPPSRRRLKKRHNTRSLTTDHLGLALDRLSVTEFQGQNAAFAGVVIDIALFGRKGFETRFDKAHLFEPVGRSGRKGEDPRHTQSYRFVDEVRQNLSTHAQVAVD